MIKKSRSQIQTTTMNTPLIFFYIIGKLDECAKHISIQSRYKNDITNELIINKSDLCLLPGETDEEKIESVSGRVVSDNEIHELLKNKEWTL